MAEIGILGGTFNPPHLGHLHAARAAAAALGLQKVLLIPANIPPHKGYPSGATSAQRLEMTRLAAQSDPLFEVDGRELARPGKSYTIDTIHELAGCFPGAGFWFIVGTDMFLTLHQWHRASELLSKTGIAVVPRGNEGASPLWPQKKRLEEEFGAKIAVVDVPPLVVSSTDLRVGQGESLVTKEVAAYIEENGLYGRTADTSPGQNDNCNFPPKGL